MAQTSDSSFPKDIRQVDVLDGHDAKKKSFYNKEKV